MPQDLSTPALGELRTYWAGGAFAVAYYYTTAQRDPGCARCAAGACTQLVESAPDVWRGTHVTHGITDRRALRDGEEAPRCASAR